MEDLEQIKPILKANIGDTVSYRWHTHKVYAGKVIEINIRVRQLGTNFSPAVRGNVVVDVFYKVNAGMRYGGTKERIHLVRQESIR